MQAVLPLAGGPHGVSGGDDSLAVAAGRGQVRPGHQGRLSPSILAAAPRGALGGPAEVRGRGLPVAALRRNDSGDAMHQAQIPHAFRVAGE